MEVVMKKHTMVMTAMMAVVFTTGVMAQTYSFSYISRAENGKKNYTMGLRSSNQGLAESAMMQVAKIKMIAPTASFEDVKNIIDSLSVYGDTPSVRYKAYLASNVCGNPTWFEKKAYLGYQDNDEFFAAVAAQLQERILGSRAN
jgi:hypothetical protein